MSRDLADLTDEFCPKVQQVIANCAAAGITMVPYFTLRDPHDQALLWRQFWNDRTEAEVAALRAAGAPWLADILEATPFQKGPWATNGVPGNSWHQFGLACDCYWSVKGAAEWGDGVGYVIFAKQAEQFGLTSGRHFTRPDIDHVQLQPQGAPADIYSWPEIDAAMKQRFGGT